MSKSLAHSCTCIDTRLTQHSPGVDPPYPVYGGIFREEAIMLLRRFYVQENEKGITRAACLSPANTDHV